MIDFVVVSHPGRPATAKTKRQAHSHAARAAHARARNLEVKRYTQQRETASNEASDDRRSSSNRHAVRGRPGVSVHVPAVVTGAFEHEPLRDFLQSLTQNEHKLFHHYITIVFPGMNASCPVLAQLSSGARNLAENWLLLSSTSTMFLRGFLLSACRHLAMAYPEAGYEHVAQQYKWTYIRALQQELAVGNGLVSVATATLAMVLVFDDISIGDFATAAQHAMGVVQIVHSVGGFASMERMGLFVRHNLLNCIYGKELREWSPQLTQPDTLRLLGVPEQGLCDKTWF